MNNVNDALFQPHDLGTLTLPNRVLMSPLTRSRSSQPGDVPNDMNAVLSAACRCRTDHQRSNPGVTSG